MAYLIFIVVSYAFRRCCCCNNLVLGLHWSCFRVICQTVSSADSPDTVKAPHTTKLSFTPLWPSCFITKENKRSESECDHSLKRVISLGGNIYPIHSNVRYIRGMGQENILVSTCLFSGFKQLNDPKRHMCHLLTFLHILSSSKILIFKLTHLILHSHK